MKDEREQRVTSQELRKDPAGVVKKAVTNGAVVITSEQGQPRIRISVPRGPLPPYLD